MKRRIKYYKRNKAGKTYHQPWIGYSYRRENGTPDFKREISLAGFDSKVVEAIDLALRCEGNLGTIGEVSFERGLNIGAAWSAWCVMENMGIVEELGVLDEKHRPAILAMILDRVISPRPHSKLGLWETLPGSALERIISPGKEMPKNLHDFYAALDSLHDRQGSIQQALFKRRESSDCTVFLYDITSSYMEGTQCPLSEYGYNRDGKKGKLQIVIGLLTDSDGRPLAVEVFEGNTSDQSTVMERIDSMRKDFGLGEMVFIGDRGMLTRARRENLEADEYEQVKYISALTRREFFGFLDDQDHPLQLSLFDRHKLVEVEDTDSGVRYIMSFNPEKEEEDREVRRRLLAKTEEKLHMIRKNVENGKWKDEKVIAKRLHTWINKWNMERFFIYEYGEGVFKFDRNDERIRHYEAIDGFYVITTDTAPERFDTCEVRKRYKSLSQVEQAFRAMKTTDLFLRPVRHWSPTRVKGHVFMCMLSYLVVWETRHRLDDVISKKPVPGNEACSPETSCHSLRTVWETLDAGMQIGTIRVGGNIKEHLSPIPEDAKNIMEKIGAKPNSKRVARIQLVG